MKWFVTGGAGFIGSHFTDLLLEEGHQVLVYDALTYAANRDWVQAPFVQGDICDRTMVAQALYEFGPDVLVNFAAESHVDNSYRQTALFTRTNVDGVVSLLEGLRDCTPEALFVQISTDEVYGDDESLHAPHSPLNPQNPYSATKAAAEYMVNSYARSFGLRTMVTRSSNNWGPRQHHEKFIPAALKAKLTGVPMIVHGYDLRRDWLNVEDNVRAIYELASAICEGVWNIATGFQHNLSQVLDMIGDVPHRVSGERPGVDRGYTVDPTATWGLLGWVPTDLAFDMRLDRYVADFAEQFEEVSQAVLLPEGAQARR